MKMNEFMTTLQQKMDDMQPKYPNNAESILEVVFLRDVIIAYK